MPHGVSTAKSGSKKGAQKYQNTFAFKHNSKSKLSQKITAMPNDGVCNRCYEQIEWRKKFKKYKPLTQPKKCVDCQQKTVTQAYHVICGACAQKKDVCAKCLEKKELVESAKTEAEKLAEETELRLQLMTMTERQRRSYFRKLERKEEGNAAQAGEEGYVTSGESDAEDDDDDDDKSGDEEEGSDGRDRAAAVPKQEGDEGEGEESETEERSDASGEGEADQARAAEAAEQH